MDSFASHRTKDDRKAEIATSRANIQDIQALVRESLAKYSDERRFPRARKWLQRALSKIHHYSNIVDVFVQHHPEYVALVWGAMKILLVSAQNHETTICTLSKALAQIAEKLPQVELATVLCPTARMREAVGKLYANLLQFFIRAHNWYREGPWRHFIHSITRPVELRYKDLLDEIDQNSRNISQLVVVGAQVKVYEMDQKLDKVISCLASIQALNSSAHLDTKQMLTDLQFSQIMTFVSTGRLGDPARALQFNESLRRRARGRTFGSTNRFWESQALADWSAGNTCQIAILQGNYRARLPMREFCVEIISQLKSKNTPVLWALPGADTKLQNADISAIDIFKHLVFQALQVDHSNITTQTDSRMALQCTRFQQATTEREWIKLLGAAIEWVQTQIYLVVDLSVLSRDPGDHLDYSSWTEAFRTLIGEISQRYPNLKVKVLLLSDPSPAGKSHRDGADQRGPEVVVPVRVTQTPIKKRKRFGKTEGSWVPRRQPLL